jgi:D-inositol-3-phosphate glycosyltransferase
MHTTAKVKNSSLALGDAAEPAARVIGEEQVVEAADLIVANTREEARQLIDLYGAAPSRVRVITPGVDLDVFTPGDKQAARAGLGLPTDALVVMFAGRIQPLKAPDVLLAAAAKLVEHRPDLRARLVVPVIGGPSGSGLDTPRALVELAGLLGISDLVRFIAPVEQVQLVEYYRAASLVVVPSYTESFGLVAIEAQACGTPVVASDVGGLPTAVVDGETGVLVDGHDPAEYAHVIGRLLDDPARLGTMSRAGAAHAGQFGWSVTAQRTLEAYSAASELMHGDALAIAT